MGIWNYRVLCEEIDDPMGKCESFRIVEVYYHDDGSIQGWADCTDTILRVVDHPYDENDDDDVRGHAYSDLKGSAHHVIKAFDLPTLALKDDGETLYELEVGKDDE